MTTDTRKRCSFCLRSILLIALAVAALPGCISKDQHRFRSTIYHPQNVELVDPHSGHPVWKKEVPVGHDLIIDLDRKNQPEDDGIMYIKNTPPINVAWEMYRTDEKNVNPKPSRTFGEDPLPGIFLTLRVTLRPAPEYPADFIPFEPVDEGMYGDDAPAPVAPAPATEPMSANAP